MTHKRPTQDKRKRTAFPIRRNKATAPLAEKPFAHTKKPSALKKGSAPSLLVLIVGIMIGFLLGVFLVPVKAETEDKTRWTPYSKLIEFTKVLHHIEKDYVDKVDSEKLIHGAINGMLDRLDPHSRFFPKEQYRRLLAAATGVYAGIGVSLRSNNFEVVVDNIAPLGPAAKKGIKRGDRVLEIDGESVIGKPSEELEDKLRGKNKTSVKLTLNRKGWKAPRDVWVQRAVMREKSVAGSLLPHETAYVEVIAFHPGTSGEIDKTLKKIAKQLAGTDRSVKNLILDLRDNTGGLMSEGLKTADLFLSKGLLISRKGKKGRLKEKYWASKEAPWSHLKIVVLINSRTASAAEITAVALRENDKAKVVGRTSFGKGTFQELIKLAEGSVVKLTVGRYYTPKGRSLDGVGVKPDWRVFTGPPPPGTPIPKGLPPEMRNDAPLLVAIGVLSGEIGKTNKHRNRI